MGIFDFAKKKVILSTFQNDFDKFRRAPLEDQVSAGKKIFDDIQTIGSLSAENLSTIQPQLREKYKNLRNISLSSGATNELHPEYAYAALMESVVLSLGDEQVFTKILQDIMGWLSFIGIIRR
jgi:hypothetical protein